MNNKQPIEGMKVLDFTRVLAGPFATMMLGDLGAEIIKVEPPQGDESRTWPPILPKGESGYFMILNRNKRSVTLNLKDKRAINIALELAAKVDVVMENFTPGVTQKLGIDYDSLKKVNSKIIYCSITGFGQNGPYRDKKAYDPIIQGLTGLMSITGEKEGPPAKVGIPITDLVAAIQAVVAVLSAFINRLETGEGQYVDVALYDSTLSLLTVMAMDYFATGCPPERWGFDHIHRVPARAFKTKDDRYVQVAATNEVMYPKFCKVLGLEKLISDPRFRTNTLRVKNRDQIMPLFEEKIREKDRDEWIQLFESTGIPCGSILDMGEVFEDQNVKARKMLFDMEHPIEGMVKQLGFPYKLSETLPKARRRPPLLGEHNEEVLDEWLDMSRQEILRLQELKVI